MSLVIPPPCCQCAPTPNRAHMHPPLGAPHPMSVPLMHRTHAHTSMHMQTFTHTCTHPCETAHSCQGHPQPSGLGTHTPCAPACAKSQRCPLPHHTSPCEGHSPVSTASPTCVPGSLSQVCLGHMQVGPCVSTHSPVQGHSCAKRAQLSCKLISLHTQLLCQHSALPTHAQASCTPSSCASTALCKHTGAPVHPVLVQTPFPAHTLRSCTPSPRAHPALRSPTLLHTPAGRTLVCAHRGCEGADALAGPEGPEGPEGFRGGAGEGATHAGRFLHVHLARGLAAARLADLRALRARVRVAAARERARQPLLRRHHLEPVPWGTPRGHTEERCRHMGTRGDNRMWAHAGEQQDAQRSDGDTGGYG